jgi:predicted nuclease with TOPRIM domain
MTEITNDLMYEVLKVIRADIADLKRDAKDTKAQLHGLRGQMNQMQDDMLRLERNMSAFYDRLERIETRLGLHDGPGLHT